MRRRVAILTISALFAQTKPSKEFQRRLDAYLKLRSQGVPKMRPSSDPQVLENYNKALRETIRNRRTGARPGDIFDTATAAAIKSELRRNAKNPATKQTVRTGNPANEGKPFVPAVNTPYPDSAPLSMLPPDMLRHLPKLPQELEYRFVGRTLILLDARPGLIVDLIPEALP